MSDVQNFVKVTSSFPDEVKVSLEDGEGNRINARSILGAIYSLEWSEIYCNCNKDITTSLLQWII